MLADRWHKRMAEFRKLWSSNFFLIYVSLLDDLDFIFPRLKPSFLRQQFETFLTIDPG
jgi:hypothetical protein